MSFINMYFSIFLVGCFISSHAQKNKIFNSNYQPFNTHPNELKKTVHKIKLKDDISNCQTNLKLFLNNYIKILMRNTYPIEKIGYVNEEGIVFKTGKHLIFIIWYGF